MEENALTNEPPGSSSSTSLLLQQQDDDDDDESSASVARRVSGGGGGEGEEQAEHVNLDQQDDEQDEGDDADDDDDSAANGMAQQQPESNTALTTATASAPLQQDQQQQPQTQPSSSSHSSSLIRCMPEQTVRRIVAGQAILDLASAVKELLDNALDAHSTCINIRLFNQGIDMLEVSDDGHGVPLPSRPFLCTPHATSKLNTLDDLQCGRCTTLGFRGEALYSLANLSSNVVIATRTQDEALAQRMQFNPQGQLIKESIVAMPRKVGTTVCVQEFLHAVPVRRADFLRRLPMQRSKLIALCQGYALFCAAGTSGSNSSNGNGNTAASSSSSSRASRADNARRRHYQYYRPPCQLRLMDMISRNDGSSEERIILQTPHQLQIQSSSSSSSSTTRLTVLLGRAISAILGTTVLSKLCEVSINVTDVVVAATASKKDATAIASNDPDGSDDDDDDEFLVNPDGTPRWTVAGFISKALPATPTASLNAENNRKKGDAVRPINGGGVKASRRVGHIPTTNTGNPNHHSQPGNTAAATASAGHQFFAINGRPVEMPKLARLFNEQWRNCHSNSTSSHKSDTNAKKSNTNAKTNAKTKARGIGRPSIILQFTVPFSAYDINLSPDKRQAVLLGEDDILQRIKEVVSSLWQSQINPADAVQFQSFEESALATVAAMNKLKSSSGSRSSRSSSSCASPDNRKMDDDNDALSSPMPTTTAEQLEGSGRFNRRYAFSHDVRKARLQHEFDDGRKRPDFPSGGNSDIDDVDNDDDDDDEEGRRRRRPDYNNYQPGYGPDENDDQLDAMLWQQEQIKRKLQAQEKELQRQQQQAAAEALFAARQKEQASSSSSSPTRKHSTSSDNIENNGRDDTTVAEKCTAAAGATTTTAMRLTESLSSSIENAKTAQGISAATTSMITPSPSAPRQYPQVATMTTTTTTAMATRSYTNDNDADTAVASSASSDGFMTRSNGSSNTTHVERRQWQVTQQRFNHSHDDDDDTDTVIGGAQAFGKAKSSTGAVAGDPASSLTLLSPTLDRPPSTTTASPQKDDIRLRLNQFRAAGAGTAVDSTRSNGNMSCANTRSLDKQQSSQPKRKKSPTFSLEQFGFQKPTSTRKTATAKASAPSMTGKPNRYNEDSLESTLNGERRRPKDDETNENSEEHDSSTGVLIPVVSHHAQQAPENTATSPAGANSADTNMDSQDKQESEVGKDGQEGAGRYQRKRKRLPAPVTNASNASNASAVGGQEMTAAMNVVDDSPRSFAEEDLDQSNGSCSRERSCTQPRLSSLSQDSVFPTPTITWDTFAKGGTNQVLLESRRERLAMHERKQSLQEMQQEQQKESSSSSSSIVTLGKEDFKDMTIIGQFNKGFILAKSRNNHLWIMDQHACDEKYNFEKLVKETVIHEQRLIAPMPLELSPAEETCILDHMEIFEKNGFRFQYRENEPPRHRLALTALPHSGARDGRKAVLFGKEDVSVLCMILGCGDDENHNIDDHDDDDDDGDALYRDGVAGGGTGTDGSGLYGNNAVRNAGRHGTAASSPGNGNDTADRVIARLPKAIAMFASRACRGSIMIGRALSSTEMQRVITHLGELDHPFTCAHGRPTMQHVSNIGPMLRQDEHKAAQHRAGPTVTFLSQEANDQEDL